MSIEDLNARFGIADVAEFVTGPGGQVQLRVNNNASEALISLHGGQVLSFVPRSSGVDMFFLSTKALYAEGKAIKGGVPLCWPWFGADPENRGRPAHGFARNTVWQVASVEACSSHLSRVVLQLNDNAQTRTLWPYSFTVDLAIEIGESLDLTLTTYNTGDSVFSITQALHTYFSVDAIEQVSVTGLDGLDYLDKVLGFAEQRQTGEVRFAAEVDRIYQGVTGDLTIDDRAGDRRIRISSRNSHTAVVWNPWQEVASRMSDLAPGDYRRFVCVETANAGNEIIDVAPGQAFSLGVRYLGTT